MTDRNAQPNPDEIFARLEQMQREAEETIRKYEEMQAEMGADAVEVYSEDGTVRVKLDAEGKVKEIGIDEMAMRGRRTLANVIVATIQEATAVHGMKMAEMAQALVGDKMDVMGMVTQHMPEYLQDKAKDHRDRRGQ